MTPWFFHPLHQQPVTANPKPPACQFPIRGATPADLTAVSQIIAESFHSQKGIWRCTFPLLRLGIYEDLRHRLTLGAPHHICLVAVDGTSTDVTPQLVGTVEMGVRLSDSWIQAGRSFPYLSNLAVHPQYRRQGIASGLLQASEEIAHSWGFCDLYLHVLENNHRAQELYFKLGYRVHKIESHWNTFLFGRSRQIFLRKHLCL
ncbi:MAG: N-acetyltransferase [Nostocaceae cyanobacterium]|nr:N-acetyltransferase [Nostocaceae cyanobacterium]